jgi:hypothetical protein
MSTLSVPSLPSGSKRLWPGKIIWDGASARALIGAEACKLDQDKSCRALV